MTAVDSAADVKGNYSEVSFDTGSTTNDSQVFPAWKEPSVITSEHKKKFLASLKVGVYPETPALLSSETFPAWEEPKVILSEHDREFLRALKVGVYPKNPLQIEFLLSDNAIKRRQERKLLQPLELNEYPETIIIAADAQVYPSWLEPKLFSQKFKRSLQILPSYFPDDVAVVASGLWEEACSDNSAWSLTAASSGSWSESALDNTIWVEQSPDVIDINRCS